MIVGESAELTVAVPEAVLVVVTGVDALSVISTSNVYESAVIPEGVMHDMAKLDDAVPEGVAHCDELAAVYVPLFNE